ncbi:MAG TPA: UDP-2,3-diacylglucosamine diphosphatase, partial [Chitinophagales bacterium]|nr:UDP-2,3-diacylglucosamine diphosphatase [Chitinophagales bacterium]
MIYFASDLHLGSPNHAESLVREQLFVQWLQKEVAPNATELYIVGDLFDFWFEYKTVVPRGYVRVLGALA